MPGPLSHIRVLDLSRVLAAPWTGQNLAADEPSPETNVSDQEQLSRLDRAIANLPAGLKEPLILTALEGLSQDDAGRLLGLSAKAVEVRIYRARKALSSALSLGDA